MPLKITSVNFCDNYELDISLSNGHGILYNLASRIRTARFQPLQDKTLYQKGSLLPDGVIHWTGSIELTLDEILIELTNQISHYIKQA